MRAFVFDAEIGAGSIGDCSKHSLEGFAGCGGDDEKVDVFGEPFDDAVGLGETGSAFEDELVDAVERCGGGAEHFKRPVFLFDCAGVDGEPFGGTVAERVERFAVVS